MHVLYINDESLQWRIKMENDKSLQFHTFTTWDFNLDFDNLLYHVFERNTFLWLHFCYSNKYFFTFNFQPQHGLPDVFLWLLSGTKRLAYQRINARHLLYSMTEEEKGKSCGNLQTLFLKVNMSRIKFRVSFLFS